MMKTASELVAEARARVESISADAAAKEIARADGAVVVDVREAHELAEDGRLPGSVHAPRGMLEFLADPGTPHHLEPLHPSRRLIVYCAKGSRSALACLTLARLGYAHVADLEGGFDAWRDAGHPVERPG